MELSHSLPAAPVECFLHKPHEILDELTKQTTQVSQYNKTERYADHCVKHSSYPTSMSRWCQVTISCVKDKAKLSDSVSGQGFQVGIAAL